MKIVVDWDRCEANGVCVRAAPGSFHLDDKDQLHVLTETVPPERLAEVKQAVRDCPKQALSLSED
jgi:ferredoxin